MNQLHQLMLNMLVTKDIDNKVFDYIDPWGETIASISWEIRASYHRNKVATPDQSVFGKDILFNLTSVVEW